jgi:hypothetical protein
MTLALSRVPEPISRSWVELMTPAVELAKAISDTDFVPRALRGRPAAVAAAILYGDEIGLGPMVALQMVAMIEGKPYVAAQAQRALVLAAGHELWLDDATNSRATWAGRRKGSDQVTRITWTMDDARRAHLDRKPNWQAYPRPMLSARASAELIRAGFADVIGGLSAIEELDDFDPALVGLSAVPDTAGPGGPAPAGRRSRAPRRPAVQPVAADAVEASATIAIPRPPLRPPAPLDVPADRAPDAPELMTLGQRKRMMGLFRAREIRDRADRLILTAELIGRPIKSAKELTSAEADRIIDHLEQMGEPEATPPVGDPPPAVPVAAPAADQPLPLS